MDAPGRGQASALSPILDSLLPFRDQLTILTNLELAKAYGPTGADHAMSNSTFLSCAPAKVTEGSDYYLATTADQIAAKQMGKETRLPSLELGTDLIAQVGDCDNGLACAYQNNLSWSSPTTPLPTEADPRTVFERLFGEGGTLGSGALMRGGTGHPDVVTGYRPAELWRRQPGPVRTISTRSGAGGDPKAEARADSPEIRAALVIPRRCGRSREADVRPAGPVPGGHHAGDRLPAGARPAPTLRSRRCTIDVHHRDRPEQLAPHAIINTYHMSLCVFLEKLRAPGGRLAGSRGLLGSGMGNQMSTTRKPPALVAGGDALKGGWHPPGNGRRWRICTSRCSTGRETRQLRRARARDSSDGRSVRNGRSLPEEMR